MGERFAPAPEGRQDGEHMELDLRETGEPEKRKKIEATQPIVPVNQPFIPEHIRGTRVGLTRGVTGAEVLVTPTSPEEPAQTGEGTEPEVDADPVSAVEAMSFEGRQEELRRAEEIERARRAVEASNPTSGKATIDGNRLTIPYS